MAPVVATFDADALFDYRARRPTLQIVDGRLAELDWPELTIRRTTVGEHDLLVLTGAEPDYRWQAFSAAVVELAHRLGVAEWISLGSIPAAVPHTRPVPIIGTDLGAGAAARRRAARPGGHPPRPGGRRLRARDGDGRERHPGGRLLRPGPALRHRRRTRRPRWSCSARSGGISASILPSGDLVEEARQLRTRLDTATSLEETTRTYVERLEAMVDEERLPSGDDLITEIERFLREGGSEGTARN